MEMKTIGIELLSKNQFIFADWNGREFAMKAIKENPINLLKFSPEVRKDKEFILKAVKVNKNVVIYMDKKLKKNKSFIKKCVKENPNVKELVVDEVI